MKWISHGALALCLLGAAACRSKTPKSAPAVCALALPEHLHHAEPNTVDAKYWYSLLLKDSRVETPADAINCEGDAIRWPVESADCDPAPVVPAQPLPMSDESLIVRHAEGAYWFVWAPLAKHLDGTAVGPFAIARVAGDKLEARAIGTLRAFTEKPEFEVRELGGAHLLIASGQRCKSDASCERATRLMWMDRQHFRARPLRSVTQRTCLGPAWFPDRDEHHVALDDRWQRVLAREVEVAYEEDRIVVNESIEVNDRDREQPDLPAKLFRQLQAELTIQVVNGELLTQGQSLWETVLDEDGSTESASVDEE